MSFWHFVPGALALGFLATLHTGAAAQTAENWPAKPVKVVVNFGPGGSADNSMRPFAERLSRVLGQQFVIENRGGASGALGIEAAMKSAPDGYTYVVTPALSVAILPHLRPTPYNPIKDLVPVTQFTDGTLLFAVHPSVQANSVQELVDYAKKNPGKLSWGTAGVGSHGHIICETFKLKAGVDILHVPYRGGGKSLADFLAGVVQIHADPNTLPSVAAGKAKLLAVLDRKRLDAYPNVPVLSEIYPEIDFLGWFAMFAPHRDTAGDRDEDEPGDEQDRARSGIAAASPQGRVGAESGHARGAGRAFAKGLRALRQARARTQYSHRIGPRTRAAKAPNSVPGIRPGRCYDCTTAHRRLRPSATGARRVRCSRMPTRCRRRSRQSVR